VRSEKWDMRSQDTIAWLIRSRRYLAENFRQSPELRVAASAAGYSPYHYQRLFKELFGETPWEYVSRLRFEEAKRLLCLSSLSVSDVCLNVGYESLASFSIAFSDRYGSPPTEFRRIFAIPFQPTLFFIPYCFAPLAESRLLEKSNIR
jgi:AraC-like DNA-binding protein